MPAAPHDNPGRGWWASGAVPGKATSAPVPAAVEGLPLVEAQLRRLVDRRRELARRLRSERGTAVSNDAARAAAREERAVLDIRIAKLRSVLSLAHAIERERSSRGYAG